MKKFLVTLGILFLTAIVIAATGFIWWEMRLSAERQKAGDAYQQAQAHQQEMEQALQENVAIPQLQQSQPRSDITLADIQTQHLSLAPLTSSNRTYFYSYKDGTDAGAKMFYKLNQSTNTYTELLAAFSYRDSNNPNPRAFSPDGTKFLSVLKEGNYSDEQTLYLVDLKTDSAKILKTLPSNETFVQTHDSFAGYPVDGVEWVDDSTIKVEIFDATKVEPTSIGEEHPALRSETIKL